MKPGILAESQKAIPLILLTGVLAVISIALGSLAQDLNPLYIVLMLGLIAGWLFYSGFNDFSLHGSLVLIALSFIKPLLPGFFLLQLLLLFLILAELYRNRQLSLFVPYPVAFMLLFGFGIYGAMRIQNSLGYTYFFSTILVPFIVLTLCQNARITRDSLLLWMKAVVAVAAFVGAYGIYIAIRNPFDRLGSFWFTAMTINGFYTLAFFFALTLVLTAKEQYQKAMYAVAAFLILFGMLYTYTRMAILAVAFGMFLLMIRVRAMRYLGIVLLALTPLIIPSSMISRIELGFNSDISLIIRAIAWYYSALQIWQNPFTGIGFGVWADWYYSVIPMRILYAQHAHNLYLNVLVEIGIIGGLAYFWIIYKSLRQYWKHSITGNPDILHYGVWVSLMALLFACITDIFIQQHSISILFWLSLGLVLAQTRITANE
jgi:O-antigen ligase